MKGPRVINTIRHPMNNLKRFFLLLSLLTLTILPTNILLAGEIKLDKIINDIKTSIKHQKSNNGHQYDVTKKFDGKQYNLHCNTNLSPEEIAKKALANPSSIKANCQYNDEKKSNNPN